MKILRCSVSNFGSYKDLTFDFTRTGLTLIHGATGSGKSTLQYLVPWILYGTTAKDGNVDEVRSWKANGEPTIGHVLVFSGSCGMITVTRIRGTNKENDLYWETEGSIALNRGKDMADTQKLLNDLLGVDYDTFSTATCFNEFSEASLFFLAKTKDKRAVFEKVANLSFPANLALKTAEARKATKKEYDFTKNDITRQTDKIDNLEENRANTLEYSKNWEKDRTALITKLKVKYQSFEKEKESNVAALETKAYRFDEEKNKNIDALVDKLDSLESKIKNGNILAKKEAEIRKSLAPHCPECGRANNTSDKLEKLKATIETNNRHVQNFTELSVKLRQVQESINPYKEQVTVAKKAKNHYIEQIQEKDAEHNPFTAQISVIDNNIPFLKSNLELQIANCNKLDIKLSALDQLHSLSFELRGLMLSNTIKRIQDETNAYLDKYFEGEFKVLFQLDADSVEIEIQKNGHPCVYRQLSKGQRQLLKLCFSVSVMRAAADNVGVTSNLLTFDEALDGLDPDLKVRAYGLFESLSKHYASILVIDHTPEFHSLFSNSYKVTLASDESEIQHEQS